VKYATNVGALSASIAVYMAGRIMDMRRGTMIQDTLDKREETHGDYIQVAHVTQSLLAIMEFSKNWDKMDAFQRESLHMIAVKVARILEGDACELDHWHDVAGYATLTEAALKRVRP
jgi:hypothetical protein